jgi:hypothetical protein
VRAGAVGPARQAPGTPPSSSRRAAAVHEAAQCFTEYPTVALQALQHNLSTLDMPAYK